MASPKVKVAAQHDPETLLTSLNSDQRQAVQSALGADDYICILGKAASGGGVWQELQTGQLFRAPPQC